MTDSHPDRELHHPVIGSHVRITAIGEATDEHRIAVGDVCQVAGVFTTTDGHMTLVFAGLHDDVAVGSRLGDRWEVHVPSAAHDA